MLGGDDPLIHPRCSRKISQDLLFFATHQGIFLDGEIHMFSWFHSCCLRVAPNVYRINVYSQSHPMSFPVMNSPIFHHSSYPLVNQHRPWQMGVGRLVSTKNWRFSVSMLIYLSVKSQFSACQWHPPSKMAASRPNFAWHWAAAWMPSRDWWARTDLKRDDPLREKMEKIAAKCWKNTKKSWKTIGRSLDFQHSVFLLFFWCMFFYLKKKFRWKKRKKQVAKKRWNKYHIELRKICGCRKWNMIYKGGGEFTNAGTSIVMSTSWKYEYSLLVGGWRTTPLKNDGVRQLGLWHSIYGGK